LRNPEKLRLAQPAQRSRERDIDQIERHAKQGQGHGQRLAHHHHQKIGGFGEFQHVHAKPPEE